MLYDVLLDDDIPAESREDSCNCDGGAHEMFCSTCEDSKAVGDLKLPPKLPAAGSKTKPKPGKRFDMNWTVDLDRGWLPDSKQTLQLCRESFSFLYGFSPNLIKVTSKKMKAVMSADISSIRTERQYDHRSYFGKDFTIKDIQKIFDSNGVESNFTEQRAALLRASDIHIDAMVWMEEYFGQYECQPNAAQIHVDATFKRTIWQEYCKAPLPSKDRLSEVMFLYMRLLIKYFSCQQRSIPLLACYQLLGTVQRDVEQAIRYCKNP